MGKGAWTALIVAIVVALAWTQATQPVAEQAAATPSSRTASDARHESSPGPASRLPAFLPSEAADTLALIDAGGPFPYRQDGGVFQNRERLLPSQPRGYYHEYTVDTPGSRDRGARRIVTGGDPPVEFFYTDDHYRSFRRFTRGDMQ